MGFKERMRSVDSLIKEESGFSLANLRSLSDQLVQRMWPHDRVDVIKDFSFASAVYEWAMIDWVDDLADATHLSSSRGVFQAYRDRTLYAFMKHQRMREYLIYLSDPRFARSRNMPRVSTMVRVMESALISTGGLRAKDKTVIIRAPSGRMREPGPIGKIPGNLPGSDNRILNEPIINLVGKLQLSIDKANYARERADNDVWDWLPDDVLTWVLLCFEGAGEVGQGDRIQLWNRYLQREVREPRAVEEDRLLHFKFAGGDNRRQVLQQLRIDFRETCRMSELLTPLVDAKGAAAVSG